MYLPNRLNTKKNVDGGNNRSNPNDEMGKQKHVEGDPRVKKKKTVYQCIDYKDPLCSQYSRMPCIDYNSLVCAV